ncbi:MAG TPA: hypothetical protein VN108_03955 [Marmoricola sp.]|nr:hypothetical protein [Marmoricola sp.]
MIQPRTINRLIIWSVVLAVVVTGLVVGLLKVFTDDKNSSSTAAYCNQVSNKQSQISAIATSVDTQTALINGLALFQSLASSAPADISAQWMTLNTAIEGLKAAIAATGHRPSDFANGSFPGGLTSAQKVSVVAAADTLGSAITTTALSQIVQEVRDVCQVDLNL